MASWSLIILLPKVGVFPLFGYKTEKFFKAGLLNE